METQVTISEATQQAAEDFLDKTGDHDPSGMYRLFVDELERPLLEVTMKHTRGNQSRAATILSMNRATLRSKLKRHGLL